MTNAGEINTAKQLLLDIGINHKDNLPVTHDSASAETIHL